MASIIELLAGLNTKEEAVSTADLAKELHASKEGTLKQLTREKDKGNVEGNSQEGWLITEAGRKALARGEVPPTMLEEEVTPRQQFQAIGRRIGIPEDRIILASDIVWSGDYNDIGWVWGALGQADIADDLRSVWVNSWRAKLHKGIPPELETELTGVSKAEAEAGEGIASRKPGGREFIIVDDEPVRVGGNLGDYSLQDAKDILTIRALKSRFGGVGQQGATAQPSTTDRVSDILTALSPYLNKESKSDINTLKEVIEDKLALQRQEILSQLPQQGQPIQPKSFMEQVTEVIAAMGALKDAGPILRSILGVPEASSNPLTPTQIMGLDGQPAVMDLTKALDLRKFLGDEKRADERHQSAMGLVQTIRENVPDGIQAILATVSEVKGGTGAKKPAPKEEQQLTFECGVCGTQFSPPAGWEGQPLTCPKPGCGRVYTKEELMG